MVPGARKLGGRGRRLIPWVVAAMSLPVAIVVQATVATSGRLPADDRRLSSAIEESLAQNGCTPPDVALRVLGELLASEQYSGWTLRMLAGAKASRCVSVAVDARNGWVLLVPGSDPELSAELSELRSYALHECLSREQLVARVRAIAARHGLGTFDVRDGGPITIPTEDGVLSRAEQQAALEHYAEGCYLYSSLTWAASGKPVFLLAGRLKLDVTSSPP